MRSRRFVSAAAIKLDLSLPCPDVWLVIVTLD